MSRAARNFGAMLHRVADGGQGGDGRADGAMLRARRDMAGRQILTELFPHDAQRRMMEVVAAAKVSCVQANRRAGKTRGIGAVVEARVIRLAKTGSTVTTPAKRALSSASCAWD